MIGLTNGLVRINVLKKDVNGYLKLGWKLIDKKINLIPTDKKEKNGKKETTSDAKQK